MKPARYQRNSGHESRLTILRGRKGVGSGISRNGRQGGKPGPFQILLLGHKNQLPQITLVDILPANPLAEGISPSGVYLCSCAHTCLEPISNSMMMTQRTIMRLEQGATGLARLEALPPRRKAAWHLPRWRYKHHLSAILR